MVLCRHLPIIWLCRAQVRSLLRGLHGHTGVNVRDPLGVEHSRTVLSFKSIPRKNTKAAIANTNATAAIAAFRVRGLMS